MNWKCNSKHMEIADFGSEVVYIKKKIIETLQKFLIKNNFEHQMTKQN